MSILTRIRDALLGLIDDIKQNADEREEQFQQRRAKTLKEKLAVLAKNSPYKNYLKSSEDLAYLVKLDGSYEGRKELWTELGFDGQHAPTDDAYKGSGEQNTKLHAALMKWLATTGNVPWPKYE
jgi:hypothetical protein